MSYQELTITASGHAHCPSKGYLDETLTLLGTGRSGSKDKHQVHVLPRSLWPIYVLLKDTFGGPGELTGLLAELQSVLSVEHQVFPANAAARHVSLILCMSGMCLQNMPSGGGAS